MGIYNITDFGAVEGTVCTGAIQAAFDKASATGGTVLISEGTYISGTVNMGSASLIVEKGGVLKASANPDDFSEMKIISKIELGSKVFLYSVGSDGVRISGDGVIDLNNYSYESDAAKCHLSSVNKSAKGIAEYKEKYEAIPTVSLLFINCTRLRIDGLKICNTPLHAASFIECKNVKVSDITLENLSEYPGNDGLSFSSCSDIIIHGCSMNTGDCCISLNCITDWDKPCENVVISDCVFYSLARAISIGFCHSIVRNVTISNCIVPSSNSALCISASAGTGLVENILCENLYLSTSLSEEDIRGNGEPISIDGTLVSSSIFALTAPKIRNTVSIKNVRMANIICKAANAIGIIGQTGSVQDITISRLTFTMYHEKDFSARGRLIDLVHGVHSEFLPNDSKNYWLYVDDAKNLYINDASVEMYNGECLFYHKENCSQVQIIERS